MRPVEAWGLQHYPPNDEANGAKKRPELCPALPLLAAVPGGVEAGMVRAERAQDKKSLRN